MKRFIILIGLLLGVGLLIAQSCMLGIGLGMALEKAEEILTKQGYEVSASDSTWIEYTSPEPVDRWVKIYKEPDGKCCIGINYYVVATDYGAATKQLLDTVDWHGPVSEADTEGFRYIWQFEDVKHAEMIWNEMHGLVVTYYIDAIYQEIYENDDFSGGY